MADRILWILAQRNISQRELARRAGLRDAHIGVIVSRSRKNPEANIENDTLAAIARGGEVSLRWLATGEGSPDPTDEEVGSRPVLGNLPGWGDAESQVRRMLKSTPEWVFTCARNLSGLNVPSVADVELVMKAVMLCRDYPPRDADTEETAAARGDIERLKREHEARIHGQRASGAHAGATNGGRGAGEAALASATTSPKRAARRGAASGAARARNGGRG